MVDFDSSHCVEFTRRINHIGIDPEQWVDGGRVVIGCPGTSLLSPERVPGFTDEMKQLGVPLVDNPADMLGCIDAVMIESVDGSVHWDRAKPFIEAGVICFVDKPFTCSLFEARRMVDLADRHRVPLFSSSALRYAPELVDFITQIRSAGPVASESSASDKTAASYPSGIMHGEPAGTLTDPPEGAVGTGTVLGAIAYGPSPTRLRNPGLYHYGIHSTEVLFTLLGSNWDDVEGVRQGGIAGSEETGGDVVTGRWNGGRFGTVRGIRSGHRSFGFIAFCEQAIHHTSLDLRFIYRDLLKQVVRFFETGVSPVGISETLSIMAFIEQANQSCARRTC
jgi:hypothetical protein